MAVRYQRMVGLLGLYGLLMAAACQTIAWHADPAVEKTRTQTETKLQNDPAVTEAQFQAQVAPLVAKYCFECHNSQVKASGLALDTFKHAGEVIDQRDTWEFVSKYVRTQQMPPDQHPQPTDAERAQLSTWVDGQLYAYYAAHPDPGRVTLRRLNKSEYNNTIRDLVGVDFKPADDFPQDDSGYGFDNIGDVLSLPPVLMEKYLSAADRILDEAISTEAPVSKVRHIATSQAEIGFNARGDRGDGWAKLVSLEEDDFATEQRLPAGDYLVRIKAFSEPTGGAQVGQGSDAPVTFSGAVPPTNLGIFVNGTFVQDLAVDVRENSPRVYEARVGLAGGTARISAAVRRNRGGAANETFMLNGRIGTQQPGIVYVKYMEIEGPLPQAIQRFPARRLQTSGQGNYNAQGSWVMQSNGEAGVTLNLARPQDIIFRAQVCARQAGADPVKMELRVNGAAVKTIDVLAPAALDPLPRQRLFDINLLKARPYVYETRVKLPAGPAHLSAAFVNEFEDAANTNPNLRARRLILDYLEVVQTAEPLPPAPMPATLAAYFAKAPGPDGRPRAHAILQSFMGRAYRRPVTTAEVDRVMKLYDLASGNGESFQNSVKLALKAVLVSPHFLFLGDLSTGPRQAGLHPIDEFTLASRLSYFLWSSTPDEELLSLAARGQLRTQLDAQVKRMLAASKSQSFVSNFAGQWLQLRNLPNLAPDKQMFADFDDGLRRDMARETELLFDNILHQNRSVLEFLTADYTFVNARLARFYGIEGVQSADFQRVSLADSNRRGILTQASFLTLTSNPTRTSPVKRGKFVLENLLGTPPPPPPPDVPKLEDQHAVTGSLRHQMEAHRANPVCASCHAQMDPIGFGLENFNAIGQWRDTDGTEPVDAGGTLKSGESFANARDLSAILAERRRADFLHCLTEKTLTYALGRGVESYDRPAVEDIVRATQADDCRFDTLILQVVKSLPFQMQRGGDDK